MAFDRTSGRHRRIGILGLGSYSAVRAPKRARSFCYYRTGKSLSRRWGSHDDDHCRYIRDRRRVWINRHGIPVAVD